MADITAREIIEGVRSNEGAPVKRLVDLANKLEREGVDKDKRIAELEAMVPRWLDHHEEPYEGEGSAWLIVWDQVDGKEDYVPADHLVSHADRYTHYAIFNLPPPEPPPTVTVNGVEIPKPCYEPEPNKTYWMPRIDRPGQESIGFVIYNTAPYRRLAASGLLHSTREAAQAHYEALIAPTRKET